MFYNLLARLTKRLREQPECAHENSGSRQAVLGELKRARLKELWRPSAIDDGGWD